MVLQKLHWPDWPQQLGEAQLDHWAEHGWCVLDGLLPVTTFTALQQHLQLAPLQAARLTGDQLQQQIRSDATAWLSEATPIEAAFLQSMGQLGQWLNQQFFLGIRRVEAHFAQYETGAFYAVHRDNPQGRQERAVSAVFYLNEGWTGEDGGQIRLQDRHEAWHEWLPLGNRLVLFDSDLLHEVCPARRRRQSIACWLRRDAEADVLTVRS